MRTSLVAGAALLALTAAGPAIAEEPEEYVRVCDVYGAGYFYIPGTETCLKIGGSVNYSLVQNPSRIGAGTTVIGNVEGFTFSSPGWVDRIGVSVDWEYGLGKDPFGTRIVDDYYGYLYGNASFATGRESAKGTSVVGVGGVTQVGLTFGEPHQIFGTGVGSTTNGIGVTGWSKIDNSWGFGSFGTGKIFLDDDGEEALDNFYFGIRMGGFVEYIDYQARGRARITQNGVTLAGFYQEYQYNSGDAYVGAIIGGDMYYHPTDKWKITLGAELRPAYHWGHAALNMETGAGIGNIVTENFNYNRSGLSIGGTLKAGVEYQFGNGWSGALNYDWSIIPDVTAGEKPAGPAFQPANFRSLNVQRHNVSMIVSKNW